MTAVKALTRIKPISTISSLIQEMTSRIFMMTLVVQITLLTEEVIALRFQILSKGLKISNRTILATLIATATSHLNQIMIIVMFSKTFPSTIHHLKRMKS